MPSLSRSPQCGPMSSISTASSASTLAIRPSGEHKISTCPSVRRSSVELRHTPGDQAGSHQESPSCLPYWVTTAHPVAFYGGLRHEGHSPVVAPIKPNRKEITLQDATV